MEFKPAKCPTCYGELMVPDGKDFIICMYCGVNVKIRDSIVVYGESSNKNNLMFIAENAYEAGNLGEAYEYYNKIIEHDTRNINAWLGKGKCAGYSHDGKYNRLKEAVSYFDKALTYSVNDPVIKQTVVSHTVNITSKLFNSFKSSRSDLNQYQTLIEALEWVYSIEPSIETAKWILHICEYNVESLEQYIFTGKDLFKNTNEYKQWVRERLDHYDDIIRNEAKANGVELPKRYKNRNILIIALIIIGFLVTIYLLDLLNKGNK